MDIMESQEVPEIQANAEVLLLSVVQEVRKTNQNLKADVNLETCEAQVQQDDE